MNFWLITDTHFNHSNIKTYCKRPDNFTELLLENWRKLVQRDDTIFHLGDVLIGKRNLLLPQIGWLPGRKVLIKGNHDNESHTYYMQNGFNLCVESLVFKKILLTHHPANELPGNAVLNVYGHHHNFAETDPEKHANWLKAKQPWHKLLAVEYTEYKPVLFEEFVGQLPGGKVDLV